MNRVYTYDYDANYNIRAIVEKDGGIITRNQMLVYDKLDRVETSTQFNETYSYDVRGNRQTLQSESPINLPGNVAFEYDEWDRLTKVTRQDGGNVTYRYNGDNLLVERTENGETIRYYYDDKEIVAEGIVQPNGSTVERVSYLRGGELAMLEEADGTKGYYVVNGHGDVTGIVGASGELLNSYAYDIWGNALSATETVANSFRYSGEYWDETTKLQYLRALV